MVWMLCSNWWEIHAWWYPQDGKGREIELDRKRQEEVVGLAIQLVDELRTGDAEVLSDLTRRFIWLILGLIVKSYLKIRGLQMMLRVDRGWSRPGDRGMIFYDRHIFIHYG